MNEVRCSACGAANRLERFSIRREAHCGACKGLLPEPRNVRVLRPFYRWRRWMPLSAMAMFLVGLVISAEWDSWMLGMACSMQTRPRHGLFARYHEGLAQVPLLITSSPGSDYFVKFVTVDGSPVAAFYVHGGQDLRGLMPRGAFIEKDAAGEGWCGEQNLFGSMTKIEEGVHTVVFSDDGFYTLKLTKRADGNFPTKSITSKQFKLQVPRLQTV